MKRVFRLRRILTALLIILGLPLIGAVVLLAWVSKSDNPFFLRRVDEVQPYQDMRWRDLSRLDLRAATNWMATVGFNLQTRWPPRDRLPAGPGPGMRLTNAMNPGLGVRELHHQGVTGRGVGVAIIDFYLFPDHPEYCGKVAGFLDLSQAEASADGKSGQGWGERCLKWWIGPLASMHGPAVASLLVGEHCGTAPGASLYYIATPDPGGDSAWHARGLDWVLEQNRQLPRQQHIRVVSVSAAPSGKNIRVVRNARLWDEACQRAEENGVLVIDGTLHRGFVGPCNLDPEAPEDGTRCTPVPARGRPDFYQGRLLAPVGPRTTAEEYRQGRFGYQYTGPHKETFFFHGSSWSMPYVAGVAAMGWQLNPGLSAQQVKQLLFDSATVLPGGNQVINPRAFIERVRQTCASQGDEEGSR